MEMVGDGDGKEEVVVVGGCGYLRLCTGGGWGGGELLPFLLQQRECWVLSRSARTVTVP